MFNQLPGGRDWRQDRRWVRHGNSERNIGPEIRMLLRINAAVYLRHDTHRRT